MSFSKHFREERGEVAVNNLEEPLKVVIDEQDFQRKMDSEKKVNDANMGRSNHLRTQKSVIDGGTNLKGIDNIYIAVLYFLVIRVSTKNSKYQYQRDHLVGQSTN